MIEGSDIVETILKFADGNDERPSCDLIVTGATQEPLLKTLFMGNISARLAARAGVTVIMVKRRSGPLHSFLRQTVVTPGNSLHTEPKTYQNPASSFADSNIQEG